jgi:hypothetical protein
MSNLLDFKNKNTVFTGLAGVKVSGGATGDRVNEQARLRFNSSTNLMEYYTGTEWKPIDSPPSITGINVDGGGVVTSAFIDSSLSGNASIVIIGSLFASTSTVLLEASSGSNITPSTTTFNSSSQLTITVPYSSFINANEPYSLKVSNVSGLNFTLDSCLSVDTSPFFTTASGSLGTIGDAARSSYTLSSAAATDNESDPITYSIISGSLPTGLSLNSSTAAITGTASAVVSNTTSNFTVQAATTNATVTRAFSITVNAPVVQTFTYTGSDQNFTAPTGVNVVNIEMWGAGGGNGNISGWSGGGNGAAAGYATGQVTVTPGNAYKIVIGQAGAAANPVRKYGGGGRAHDNWGPGSAGGLSGFFLGSGTVFSGSEPQSGTHARSVLIAGGGGGGGANRNPGSTNGGAGGGTNGQDGNSSNSSFRGQAGTQNAGGSGSPAQGGSELRGGDGNGAYGAGGGGGYWGGGAGAYQEPNDMGGGGGGSGYFNPTYVNSATLTGGSGTTPGNSGDSDRSGAGAVQANGIMILRY